jgi:hypothetical protein
MTSTRYPYGETGKPKGLSPLPLRSYEMPGGPYAKNLGKIDRFILAEIERGGDEDQGYGVKR